MVKVHWLRWHIQLRIHEIESDKLQLGLGE